MVDKVQLLASLQENLAYAVKWDPSDTSDTPEVDIDVKLSLSAWKSYLKESGLGDQMTALSGTTLHQTAKKFPLGDVLNFANGKLDETFMLDSVKGGVTDTGWYRYSTESIKDFLDSTRESQTKLTEILNKGSTTMDLSSIVLPGSGELVALNKLLGSVSLPRLEVMVKAVQGSGTLIKEAQDLTAKANTKVDDLETNVETLQKELRNYVAKVATTQPVMEIEASGDIPEGKTVFKKASEVFGMDFSVDFDLPCFEWEGPHPNVPAIDPYYIFREKELTRVLYAIVTNQRMYLHGHTGTGKTTLVEQVSAYLDMPFVRINFDSEIQRGDLIGRDVLTVDDDGKQYSEFVEGMLPRAMASPCFLMLDEIDFVRPDVAYVMQAATEGNGLRITEDGDRFVQPHPMFRMFASGNTVGQGDEDGLYQGARPQSAALLNRFTIWAKVDYLTKDERETLIKRHVPTLPLPEVKQLSKYVDEHLDAFMNRQEVMLPISPRGFLAVAKASSIFGDLKEALNMTILDSASSDDRTVLRGLIDRTIK